MSLAIAPAPASAPSPTFAPPPAVVAGRETFLVELPLRHAGRRRVRIACEWQGNTQGPAWFVAGGISADRHVAPSGAFPEPGWWPTQVGPGRALDPRRGRVLAIDWLGADGSLDVPIDTADQADAIAAVLDRLGITRLDAFVGASYGAMVGLQFAARHPARLHRLVAISGGDRPHPFASAWRAVQRGIVALGRRDSQRREALALARQLAMLSYRTPEEFAARFGEPPALTDRGLRCASDDYLAACGARYAARTSATAFLRLSESIDLHAVDVAAITTPTTVVGIEEDRLVPIAGLEALAANLGARGRLERLSAQTGHDAFLTEPEAIAAILDRALTESRA